MAIEAAPVAQSPQTSYDEWLGRRWKVTGRIIALLWLVAVLAILLVGERRSDLGLLHGGLSDGSVTEVEIVGLSEEGVSGGYATVRLVWESRVLNRYTEVMVVSPDRSSGRPYNSEDLPVVVRDPRPTLEELQPGVEIVLMGYRSGTSWEAGGWSLRGWPSMLVGPLWLGTLFMLMGGPQPWRATRWAWFWIMLATPFYGAVAYVLLGGPLAAGRPANRSRRLTGGWAFLIALFLGGFAAD